MPGTRRSLLPHRPSQKNKCSLDLEPGSNVCLDRRVYSIIEADDPVFKSADEADASCGILYPL